MDLFLREAADRIGADDVLRKIDRLMNWQSFLPILKRGMKRTGIGPQGYDPLVLFKCLLIGQWHGLSDPKLERAEGDGPDDPELHFSADPDARWVKKGSKSTLGYKGFARTDEEGFVTKVHTTSANKGPANKGESPAFATMIDGAKAQRVLADKACASKANRDMLRSRHRDGILGKAGAQGCAGAPSAGFGKALQQADLEASFPRRALLRHPETPFGKRLFGLHRARYCGLAKTHAHLAMAAIGQTLLKAANKIKINPQAQAIA